MVLLRRRLKSIAFILVLLVAGAILTPDQVEARRRNSVWTLLVHTAQGAGASGTVTTGAIDTTGASLIVIILAGATSGVSSPCSGFTDSASNTNYFCTKGQGTSTDSLMVAWIVNPTTSASHTFTFTAAVSFPSIAVMAFSGTFGGVELWKSAQSTSSTTVLPGSITPSLNNALIISGYSNAVSTGSPTYSINAGFTKTDQVTGAATPTALAAAYLIQTSATAANPTWTTTSASTTNQGVIMSFLNQPASGGGETSAVFSGGS